MPCYHPVPARQTAAGGPVQLHPPLGTATLHLACGGCVGCRLKRASEWALRCSHEAGRFDRNVFITLTYDDEHLPSDGGLVPEDLQLFMKRLRKRTSYDERFVSSASPRFFACGEYGETTFRPHYHALLFDCDFADKHKVGKDLYSADSLREVWPYGDNKIGEVTAASAAYVAKYNLKGSRTKWVNDDGVILQKPFLRMSRRPGIGATWLQSFSEDLRGGFLVVDGFQRAVPRAYSRRLKVDSPQVAEQIEGKAFDYRMRAYKDGVIFEDLEAGERIALSRVTSRSTV